MRGRRIRVRRSVTYVRKTGLVEGPTKNHIARTVPVPAFLARLDSGAHAGPPRAPIPGRSERRRGRF